MKSFLDKVQKTIQDYHLIHPGDRILIGVSGGIDSVALLSVLYHLRFKLGFSLTVGHVNHQLRKGAKTDERFVEKLCQDLNILFVPLKVTVQKNKYQSSLEELARQARLKALIQLAKRKKVDSIALAHHQDDVAETVLMRILRGTGLLGLQGILPKKNISGFNIIRPFIQMSRKEIEGYIHSQGLRFRFDPTNKQLRFFRNKIRLRLLPVLEKSYNPNIRSLLAHLANNMAVDYEFLQLKARNLMKSLILPSKRKNILKISIQRFLKLHESQQRLFLRLAFKALKGDMNQIALVHLRELIDLVYHRPPGSILNLPAGIFAKKDSLYLWLVRKA